MENGKRLLDANVTNADSCETAKIKTHFAKIIVGRTEGKLYYDILWFDPTNKNYHIGYGSYNLDFVFQWLSEHFEIVDAPTVDVVEVVHGRKAESVISETGLMCTACHSDIDRDAVFCKYCGAKMDGGNEDGG